MKVLVTGSTGQLGYDVVKQATMLGWEVTGVGSSDLDITNTDEVRDFVATLKPEVIIHCAAYTAVDLAEDKREDAYNVNVNGTSNLSHAAKEIDCKFVYISTDYVFDGSGETPFQIEDSTNPIGYYGETKLKGEQVVQDFLKKYFIVRISWVFGLNGNNFVKTMLRLGKERKELNVVDDQIGSPTYTRDLAGLIVGMVQTDKYGVYHATNEGYCSWADFADAIFREAEVNVKVNRISSNEFPTKAKRPANSRLDKSQLELNGFKRLPQWNDALTRYIKELKTEGEFNEEH